MFNDDYTIDREGRINLPELNLFLASGKTLEEVKKELIYLYDEYIFEPEINISIKRYRPVTIYISGEVKKPGLYTLDISEENNSEENNPYDFPRLYKSLQIAEGFNNYANR